MNPSPDHKTEVLKLCDRLLDGTFAPDDRDRLELLVLQHGEARRAYVEYLQIHSALKEVSLRDVSLAEIVNMQPSAATRPAKAGIAWRKPLFAAAAAASILAAGWGMGTWKADAKHAAPAMATLIESKGARWESGSMTTEIGAKLSAGRLRLAAGLAILEFRRGARLTLEGPADLELISAEKCYLHHGALTAHVPPAAVGFIVETENARLVDHGTDFGISTTTEGQSRVQVFQGEVELQHHRNGDRLQLLTQQSASISPETLSRSKSLEDETIRPQKRVQPRGPNVLNITTAEGQGKAGYATSPGTNEHFSDTLLLLKYCKDLRCRRKAWLGFDLSRLQDREISEATLTLTFEPTGWGYASLLPDSVFKIYGLKDDSLDAWNEDTLDWETAPANDPSGPGVDESKVMLLGSFTMPQGVLEGAFTLQGEALAKFLQSDQNRLATLIVVRETSELKGGSVVHGFAGNNHPTLKPPTLRLVTR
jgi:hypothetical protein